MYFINRNNVLFITAVIKYCKYIHDFNFLFSNFQSVHLNAWFIGEFTPTEINPFECTPNYNTSVVYNVVNVSPH